MTKYKDKIIIASQSQTGGYVIGGAAVIAALYYLGKSEKAESFIGDKASDTIINVVGAPAEIITNIIETTVDKTQDKTTALFDKGVPGSGKKYLDDSKKAVSYSEYMREKPIVYQGAAALGNIITGHKAAEYGKYAAEQTKKYAGPDVEKRFGELEPGGKFLVGLGQAITVPFYPGGATGAGADTKRWLNTWKK